MVEEKKLLLDGTLIAGRSKAVSDSGTFSTGRMTTFQVIFGAFIYREARKCRQIILHGRLSR